MIGLVTPLRIDERSEVYGLDQIDHGEFAYEYASHLLSHLILIPSYLHKKFDLDIEDSSVNQSAYYALPRSDDDC